MNFSTNRQLELAYEFVQYTGRNVFLTGKAGTGKTTFLQNITKTTTKRNIVVAPTGVAAINAGGVTIHSFFQIAPGLFLPGMKTETSEDEQNTQLRVSKVKIDIIRSLDLLIIDEVSMVRADLLDAIDNVLRRYRNSSKPFGGVQLLLIGDLQQLAPVVKEDEREILEKYYQSTYFFGSNALRQTNYVSIELTEVYRQSDQNFINLLNNVRDNRLNANDIEQLSSRYHPKILDNHDKGYITLTTHNNQAKLINDKQLKKLNEESEIFTAEVSGDFPETSYPTEYNLILKIGAQVMFVKNDPSPEKLFYNGKIGEVVDIEEDVVFVKCQDQEEVLAVTELTWENNRYSIDRETKEITEEVTGTFKQIPLKLAWAITIHKSQGLTFDKVVIDAQAAFAHGQVYVALSRCTSLEGLILSSPINTYGIKSDSSIISFNNDISRNQPDNKQLRQAQLEFQVELLHDLFDFSSIRKNAYQLQKTIQNNHTILSSTLPEKTENFINVLNNDFYDIGQKFNNEILRHAQKLTSSVEESELIQGRIKKAISYFQPKMENELIQFIEIIDISSDNKQVSKMLSDVKTKIEWDLQIKNDSMLSCASGFNVKLFMQTKAKAAIESPSDRRKKSMRVGQIKVKENEESENPELYEQLRQWREIAADNLNVPLYAILPNKTIVQISNYLPANIAALRKIHGIGKVKAEKFGIDIISIVEEYCANNDLKPMYEKTEKIEFEPKEKKISTKQISYDMFKQGLTVEEIATKRGLVRSTILGHLISYVETGEISANELISEDKIKLISDFISSNFFESIGEIKRALSNSVEYSDIRVVIAHLKYKSNGKT